MPYIPNSTVLNSYHSGEFDENYLQKFENKTFKIHMWGINKSDGTNSDRLEIEDVDNIMETLNNAFNPFGICFILDGVDYINADEIYLPSGLVAIKNYVKDPSHYHVADDALNFYFPRKFSGNFSGITSAHSQFLAVRTHSYSWGKRALAGTVAHEVGHIFGLYHTFGNNNSGYNWKEHVTRDPLDPDYNALTEGDMIHDTPAMPNFYSEDYGMYEDNQGQAMTVIDTTDCSYPSSANLTDELNVPLNLTIADVENFMNYTSSICKKRFSIGQGIWMQEEIEEYNHIFEPWTTSNSNVDLYIKDSPEDYGKEPNYTSPYLWDSKDIWVRQNPDSIEIHQSPNYSISPNYYVYVRVRNRGCNYTSVNDSLQVHWAKTGTNLYYPFSWDGQHYFSNGAKKGDVINTVSIPPIPPGGQTVLQIPWHLPNPLDYIDINPNPEKWGFSLLAKIISDEDPLQFESQVIAPILNPYICYLDGFVKNNNNVAQKNISIITIEGFQPMEEIISVGNALNQTFASDLIFFDENFKDQDIFNQAEISFILDDVLYQAWKRGGKALTGLKQKDKHTFVITNKNAKLNNLLFEPYEEGTLRMKYNFLTKEVKSNLVYSHPIIQLDHNTQKAIGGHFFKILNYDRNLFYAKTEDEYLVDKNQTVKLSATPIGEPALYNWYDNNGYLLHEGLDYNISTEINHKYVLEIIAEADGYKDYSEIKVKFKPNRITSLNPNPVLNQTTVNYQINEGTNAYLILTSIEQTTSSYNYLLNIDKNELNIDLNTFPTGAYLISLIVNDKAVDSKTLIKQ